MDREVETPTRVRLRRGATAAFEYFGLAEDPSRPPEGTVRRPEWFLVLAPLLWGAVVASRQGALFGVLIGLGFAPLAVSELRESRGAPRFRRTHPYLEALAAIPLAVGVVALAAPDAAVVWFVGAGAVAAVLSLLARRRELVRKATEAHRREQSRVG